MSTRPNPTVTAESLSWWERAACRFTDPDDFFPDGQEDDPAVAAQIERAKKVCAACPVRARCLEYAMATFQKHGVYGGTTPEERRLTRRRGQRRRREYSA